ncbi:hypothetical protein D3C85_274620 [compost metagenome]
MPTKHQMALNAAADDIRTWLARTRFAMGSIDAKRPCAWDAYGYPENPCFQDFYRLWARGGIAHGTVMRLNEKCFEDDPEVIEGDPESRATAPTRWEKDFNALAKRLKLWEKFRETDMRRLVGQYACLILQVADNKAWNQPLERVSAVQLINVLPSWQGQMIPASWDTDELSPTFGAVTMWNYLESQVGQNEQGEPGRSVEIHPSRVLVLGDVRDGVPFLRAALNDFITIEKVIGSAGESFLKNASRQLSINFDKDTKLDDIARAHGIKMSEIQTLFDDVTRGMNMGQDQSIITQGAAVTPLVANVPDPRPAFDIALQSASASVRIPAKIIVGNQTGERASTEDLRDFNKRCQGRRLNVLSADVESLIAKFVAHGILRPVETSVVWSDLTEMSLEEKLANALKMVECNSKSLASGEMVFTVDEIRTTAGYEVLPTIEPLPDEDPEPLDEETGL